MNAIAPRAQEEGIRRGLRPCSSRPVPVTYSFPLPGTYSFLVFVENNY